MLVDDRHVFRHVHRGGDDVVFVVPVLQACILAVQPEVLKQRHAFRHRQTAVDLSLDGVGVDRASGIVAADQITKALVLAHIPLHSDVTVLSGVVGLTYVRNFGAAFSSFQGMQWLFALIFIVFTLAVIWEYRKKAMPFTGFERWCIAAIYGGGLGNMIDRIRFGYVVDMIETQFMEFPVFNVADCFITCGCIALIAHLILCNKEFWKEEKKK